MNTPTIEELRSEEAHCDMNFTELQALRKIHQETLKKVEILEKHILIREEIILSLMNDKRKIAEQLGCATSHINEALANAANSESTIDAVQGQVGKNAGSEAF